MGSSIGKRKNTEEDCQNKNVQRKRTQFKKSFKYGQCNSRHESEVNRLKIELENVKNRNALLEIELSEMRKSPTVSSALENSLREENRGLEKRFEETLIAVGNELAHLQRPITAFIMPEGGSVQVGDNNVMRIISHSSADISDNNEVIGKLEQTINNLMDENGRLVRINADQRMLLYQTQTQCKKMRRNIIRIANVLRMKNNTIDSKLSHISSLVRSFSIESLPFDINGGIRARKNTKECKIGHHRTNIYQNNCPVRP